MRAFVTGGSGFIGSNLVTSLARHSEVRNFDPLAPRDIQTERHWIKGSVLDSEHLGSEIKRFHPDVIFHLGARTDLAGRDISDYDANTKGVRSVIRAVRTNAPHAHTIFASSRLVFAIDHQPKHLFDYRPSTPYGESKIRGEDLVREHMDASWTIVRPTSIWGPWFATPYRDFFDMVANGRYVKFRERDPLKSFGYVGNAVYQLERIAEAGTAKTHGKVLWLSDYEPLRLSRWADLVAEGLGKKPPRYVPFWMARTAARVGDFLQASGVQGVPLTSFRLHNLVTDMVYDTQHTENIVGPLPYSLEEGVSRTISWYRNMATE